MQGQEETGYRFIWSTKIVKKLSKWVRFCWAQMKVLIFLGATVYRKLRESRRQYEKENAQFLEMKMELNAFDPNCVNRFEEEYRQHNSNEVRPSVEAEKGDKIVSQMLILTDS
jgi:hypothetical protein